MKRYLAFGSRNGVCAGRVFMHTIEPTFDGRDRGIEKKKSTNPDHASLSVVLKILRPGSIPGARFPHGDAIKTSPAKIVNGLRLRTVYALVALNAV